MGDAAMPAAPTKDLNTLANLCNIISRWVCISFLIRRGSKKGSKFIFNGYRYKVDLKLYYLVQLNGMSNHN